MTHHLLRPLRTVNAAFVAFVIIAGSLASPSAYALPSYATQTGQACSACHVGAFGPQLTPFGRSFKLGGYTMTDGGEHGAPVSLMLQSSFTNTQKAQASAPVPGFGTNNNFSLDQLSAFYAGAVTSNIGTLIQATYDGVNGVFHWDNADVRYAHVGSLSGVDYVAGVSVNNNPTVQDLWNSTPAWGFPYSASSLGLTPTSVAIPLLNAGLAQQVLGATAYASVNDLLYLEGGAYHGLSGNIRNTLGAVPVTGTDTYDGLMPYWRVALEHDFNNEHYFEIGTYGLTAHRNPGGVIDSGSDYLIDNAVDANYQWHANPDHFVSLHASYTHEDADLSASSQLNGTNANDSLNAFKTDVSYSYKNTYTPSLQYFKTTGSSDAVYWATSTGLASPNSEGVTAELAYVPFGKDDSPYPWLNGRLALQYTAYSQFDGTTSHASDNNTVFVNLWLALDPVAPFSGNKK